MIGFKNLLEIKVLKGSESYEDKVITMGDICEFDVEQNPKIVEQFQLVLNGWEVIKSYSELVDPKIQKENFEVQSGAIAAGDAEATSPDDDFVLAMEYGMPCQSGW